MHSEAKVRTRMSRLLSLIAILFIFTLSPAPALAVHTSTICPQQSATVASGGSVQINLNACHTNSLFPPFGLGPTPVAPSHGTAILGELFTPPATYDAFVTYTHNGNSATSDFFEFDDENGDIIRVVMTITPPASAIVVLPASLPTLVAGTPLSQTLTSSGGTAPYSYSLDSGTLPVGISLNSAGVLSGTPTQRGGYAFSVRSQDSLGDFVIKGYGGTVANPTLSLVPVSATAIQGTPFSLALGVNGGVAPHSFLQEPGGLFPAGISINGAGVVSGTTNAAVGNYPVTLRVTDASTPSNAAYFELETFTLAVAAPPLVSVAVSPAAVDEDGAANLVYTFTRSQSLSSPTVVNVQTTGTATAGSDYTGNAATVTIPAGATTATLTIDPTADTTIEPDETVILTVLAGSGYTVGAPASATGTITNDDQTLLSINDVTVVEGNAGTTSAAFTVSLSAPAGAGGVSFDIATANGTATAGVDYVANSLTGQAIPAGASSYAFTVLVNGDTLNEPNETFFVNVSNVVNATVADGQGLGTITNDDPLPALSINDVTVVEGNTGTTNAVFTVTLSAASGQTVSVLYATANGTATQPLDYTSTAGTLTFTPGQTSGTVTVPVNGDTTPEADETFFVNLSSAVNATLSDNQGLGTITNDDVPVTVSPATLPGGAVAAAYSQTLTASGGSAPYTFAVTAGAVPSGLSLSPAGTLAGTPTAGGSFNFTATATDSSGAPGPFAGSQAYTLVIAAPTISLPAAALADGNVGVAYSATITAATGGTAPYAYDVTAGSLPAGMVLNTGTGALTGTPSAPGTFNFSITATDSSTGTGPYTASRGYTITVVDAPPVANAVSITVPYNAGPTNVPLNITGGTPTSVSAGAASNGSAVAAGITITYQPSAGYAGPDSFTYVATNAGGSSAPALVTVTVSDPVVTITAGGGLAATVALPYSQTFTFNGGATPWSGYQVTGLPGGLAVTGTTANSVTVSGTPTAAGSFNLVVSATDSSTGNGPYTVGQAFTLTVAAPSLSLAPAASTFTVPYGAAFSQAFSAGGGVGPYGYTVTGTLPPGLGFAADTLSGTPTVPGSYSFTITAQDNGATGTGAPFTVAENYTVNVPAPTIVVDPASLPSGVAGQAYAASLSAAGGVGPYGFTLDSGALPAGVVLSGGGALSGTPTQSGSFNFTVAATDANGQVGTRPYTVDFAVPVLAMAPASLPSGVVGVGYSQAFATTGGIAPYTYAVSAGAPPTGLSLSADGTLSGTPTADGSFGFTVTVTDSTGGTAATLAQAYTVDIVFAPPVAVNDTATVLAGQTVGIAVTSNDVSIAPITSIAIASPPSQGTATVAGLDINYTAPTVASPTVSFTYIASGPGGDSAPATVTVTVNPLPVAPALTATTGPATPVQVTLTAGAAGGPFTGANVVAVSPAGSGTTSIAASGGNYVLTFSPDPAFSGVAVVRYTLDNAFATSAEGTVSITVQPRPDPSLDAEVRGLVDAQVESTKRFATSQVNNFQQRLERLHNGGDGGFDNGIGFAIDRACIEPLVGYAIDPCKPDGSGFHGGNGLAGGNGGGTASGQGGGPVGTWIGGMIRSGSQDGRNGGADIDFETDGISAGIDYRTSDEFVVGVGIGFGKDENAIGDDGSRVDGDARTVALYASYHPDNWFVDVLLGYQSLDFDLRRYITANGSIASGQRDGSQRFASVSVGADIVRGSGLLTPYARLDVAQADLDSYAESGDPIYALAFEAMDVDTTTGNIGLRMDWRHDRPWGRFTPQLRLEYQHDFSGRSDAVIRYADLVGGPVYGLSSTGFDNNRFMLGLGAMFDLDSGWGWRLEYRGQVGSSGESDNGVSVNVQKQF